MRKYQSDYKRIMSLIYEDQPISPQAGREIVYIPERIKAIRSLGRGVASYRQPREVIFLHQAKMLEDYEDDYEYTRDIPAYQPTYESLTNEQLRGYFAWRSRIRKDDYQKAPLAFAFLYMYELINLIGMQTAEQSFYRLLAFANRYGKVDSSIAPYAEQWLIDFVLYYELNPELLSERKSVVYDQALSILLKVQDVVINGRSGSSGTHHKTKASDSENVCDAMFFLSGIRAGRLPMYAENSELFIRVADTVFQEMCAYYESHRKTSFLEDYIGQPLNQPVRFFAGAVFYDQRRQKNNSGDRQTQGNIYGAKESSKVNARGWLGNLLSGDSKQLVKEIRLSEITTYHYEYGKWAVKTYPRDFQNRKFAELLQTIDAVIREETGNLEAGITGIQIKWIRKLIRKAAADCRQQLEEEKARRIEIDFSSLEGIRSDAEETMGKLMTEEELTLASFVAAEEPLHRILEQDFKESDQPEQKENIEICERLGLKAEEMDVLICLMQNEDLHAVNLNGNIMSVIVDSINEKLLDEIGDVVIEDGVSPRLIEDYKEELKEMFCL